MPTKLEFVRDWLRLAQMDLDSARLLPTQKQRHAGEFWRTIE